VYVRSILRTCCFDVASCYCMTHIREHSKEIRVTEVARPVSESESTPITLFASHPSAGFPAQGDDQVEKILDINDLVVKNPASTFFVRVAGDSMTGVGIFDSDVLVVDRSKDAIDGSIVVAAVNGELVVKRLKVTTVASKGSNPLLQLVSENDAYAPITIGDGEECFVWGVVVGSVRQFG
jgi:DNA polymerase V